MGSFVVHSQEPVQLLPARLELLCPRLDSSEFAAVHSLVVPWGCWEAVNVFELPNSFAEQVMLLTIKLANSFEPDFYCRDEVRFSMLVK